ncbi:MAG: PilW family protein [Candidatus Heimdallarchaeaceae archaeon]
MKSRGYTLIEVLVSVAVFGVIIAGPTGLFVLSLRNQNMSLALGETIDNTSHAVEYMSRALRMARKDRVGDCLGALYQNYNYINPDSDTAKIRFLNYQGYCLEFSLDGSQIMQRKSSDGTSANFGTGVYLTSDDLAISNFQFLIAGGGQLDNLQPRVTIVFNIAKDSAGTGLPAINVQTTVSQRNLDVTY